MPEETPPTPKRQIALLGDPINGHGIHPPPIALPAPQGASSSVYVNGRPVHHVGNTCIPHFGFLPIPPDLHPDILATGSPTVFANGKPLARVLVDVFAPGGNIIMGGSYNVFTP
jgi:uncharacterized Zn-binding protein involved in type VI secretion